MARLPASFEPQLATLVKSPPEGEGWLHELKYDGYRIACRLDRGAVRLLSRRGKDWTEAFPEVCAAARALAARQALVDGEVAIVLPDGRTSFQALQNAFSGGGRQGLAYFAFDLLHLDGEDLTGRPLEERKAALARLVPPGRGRGLLRYSDHVVGGGAAFFAHACRLGLEGIVSKQRALAYRPGRHMGWVKTKCVRRQEFVIGGFTDPEGTREGIGSLLVGTYEDGRLVFAGKVGTGFSRAGARALRRRLEALAQARCPFTPPPAGWLGRHAHWVRPQLVAEVAFTERTEDGKIRHPSFQGLREDKPARAVVAEAPVDPPPPAPARRRARGAGPEVAGVRLSNAERVLFPEAEVTKLALARFYEEIADHILPHLAGRPLTLVRCPRGVQAGLRADCFYMKHAQVWAPAPLRRLQIQERTKIGTYLVADDLPSLVALVQMDVLELHTWTSRVDDLERPDRLVLDLDPGPRVPFAQVIEAALHVRSVLGTLGLESFVKNTGGRGLHVVVPLVPERDHAACAGFARDLAAAIVRHDPARYTIAVPKKGREAKILLDYLRNNRGATAVVTFSTRAHPRAPVSVPLAWDELSPQVPPDHYTVRTLAARLRRLRRDPWAGFSSCRQRLTAAMLRAAARV